MLQELRISNLALIERAEVQFGPGLNVLTGETGAGKSILVQALALLTGERAASEQVGAGGGSRALVESSFDLADAPQAVAYLDEQGIATDDGQVVISREVNADGRSRVRINGRLATAATLRELGDRLVDLHGQHEHQLLLRAEHHLGFLDAFGNADYAGKVEAVRNRHRAWREAQRRLQDLSGDEQRRAQRLDMLQFQAQEIDAAELQPDEDNALLEERLRLLNTEKLRAAAALCRDALNGDEGAGAVVLAAQALKAARDILTVDSSISEWTEELQTALYALQDAAAEARSYADSLEADPLRLEEIEARLHLINRLKRKYGDSLEQVLAYRAEIEDELQNLTLSEGELVALQESANQLRAQYLLEAEALSVARHKLAKKFDAAVREQLCSLAMDRARFETQFVRDDNGTATGLDKVEFLLSANPGQPLRPLARIASGGEISRVMLALHSVLNTNRGGAPEAPGRVPVLVFDEIDTGIGGVTAEAVGEKMWGLARHFQVFCVTHLPQIARRADQHLRVAKQSSDAHTSVSVTPLDGEARVRELARMMGRESETTLRHARELLAAK